MGKPVETGVNHGKMHEKCPRGIFLKKKLKRWKYVKKTISYFIICRESIVNTFCM